MNSTIASAWEVLLQDTPFVALSLSYLKLFYLDTPLLSLQKQKKNSDAIFDHGNSVSSDTICLAKNCLVPCSAHTYEHLFSQISASLPAQSTPTYPMILYISCKLLEKRTKLYCLFTCYFFYLQIPSFSTSPPDLPIISALTASTPTPSFKIVLSYRINSFLYMPLQIHFCYLFTCLFLPPRLSNSTEQKLI